MFFRRNTGGVVEEDVRMIKTMLSMDMRRDEYALIFGSRSKPNQIALLTRSMQEILTELAAGVEVPEEDLAEGRATSHSHGSSEVETQGHPLMRIHSSGARPRDAYTAVRYRDRWFWVDDRDLASKRVFMFLMMFSALSETRAVPQVPLVTIPATR